jgi:uncharacterized membrane protein
VTDPVPPQRHGGTPRWMIVAFALSLAVNLAVVGMVGAHWAFRPPSERAFAFIEAGFLRDLPEDGRRAVRGALDERRPALRQALDDLAAARREAVALLRAPAFDRTATEAAFAMVRSRLEAVQRIVQDAAVEAMARLPADSRSRIDQPDRVP